MSKTREDLPLDVQNTINQCAKNIISTEATCIEWGAPAGRSVELAEEAISNLVLLVLSPSTSVQAGAGGELPERPRVPLLPNDAPLWNRAKSHFALLESIITWQREELAAKEESLAWKMDGVDRWLEREAGCCPEDVPFEEYIFSLKAKLEAAELALKQSESATIQKCIDGVSIAKQRSLAMYGSVGENIAVRTAFSLINEELSALLPKVTEGSKG